jgi:hypothetical protein
MHEPLQRLTPEHAKSCKAAESSLAATLQQAAFSGPHRKKRTPQSVKKNGRHETVDACIEELHSLL